jgi:exonuclease SbcC
MRILALRLQNLNSLKGTFEIDFASPPLAGAGIFAITGKTGAGKTTLLDGICLALYGRTPRLGRGQPVGEVMTRHTGTCFAEVDFAVDRGVYRSHWSLRRARARPDGALQPVKMELAELKGADATGLESGVARVPDAVEGLSGLNFERFTQSMMLAQGSFAVFLNAPARDRAELLEQMTGSEIYAQLSMAAFERAKREDEILAALLQREGDIVLLTQEELADRRARIAALEAENREAAARIEAVQAQAQWLVSLASMEKQLAQVGADLDAVQREREAAKDDFEKLGRALRADLVRPAYQVVKTTRAQIADLKTKQVRAQERLPKLDAQLTARSEEVETANAALKAFRGVEPAAEKRLTAMRLADEKIRAQVELAARAREAAVTQADKVAVLRKDTENAAVLAAELAQHKATLNAYLEAHRSDGELIERAAGIVERLRQWARLRTAQEKANAELNALRKKQTKAAAEAAKHDAHCKAAQQTLKGLAASRRDAEKALGDALQGRSLDGWHDTVQALTERLGAFESLVESAEAHARAEADLAHMREALTQVSERLKQTAELAAALAETKRQEDAILERLRETQQMERLVAGYEEVRPLLKPKEPCPLCGALEHPWAKGAPPPVSDTDAAIAHQKKRVREYEKKVEATSTDLGKQRAAVDDLTSRVKAGETQLAEFKRMIATRCGDLGLPDDVALEPPALRERRDAEKRELGKQRQVLIELRQAKENADSLAQKERDAEQGLAKAASQADRARHENADLVRRIREREEIQSQLEAEIREAETRVRADLETAGVQLPAPAEADAVAAALQARATSFRETRARHELAEKELNRAEQDKNTADTRLADAANLLREHQAEQKKQQEAAEKLAANRREAYGDGNPDEERKQRDAERDRLETALETARTNQQNARKERDDTKADIASREATIADLETKLNDYVADFETQLREQQFDDAATFEAACLERGQITALQAARKDLDTRKTRLEARGADLKKALEAERAKALTTQTPDEVNARLVQEKETQQTILTEIGAVRHELKVQQELREKRAELVAEIEKQRRECNRWDALNTLIGSADGRKFRTFAQGLTLEVLVQLANDHLSRLNDRYILKRADENGEPLGLETVDTYQADTVRPPSTLSGGETFLASLALALGLSSLASRRSRIDSLFLDEGFGTLDADALDVALDALNSLNAAGKTIGVISHVEQLKERVPVRIEVTKLAGGVSTLDEIYRRQ